MLTVDVQNLQIASPVPLLIVNTLFTNAFLLIAKNDFLFGDSFRLWERNGTKQKHGMIYYYGSKHKMV